MVFVNRVYMNWLILGLGLYKAIWVTIGLDSDSVLNMWPSIFDPYPHCTVPEHLTTIYIQSCKMVKDFDTGIDVQSYNLWAATFEKLVFLLQKLSSETPHMRNFFGTDGWRVRSFPTITKRTGPWSLMIIPQLLVLTNHMLGFITLHCILFKHIKITISSTFTLLWKITIFNG